jgi:UTP--glucose-1-phosphate uridylyltransferase
MSNLFTQKKGVLMMNPIRSFPSLPLVKLGSAFTKVNEFLKRFGSIPDVLELDHLTVSGDVTFGKGVILRVYFLDHFLVFYMILTENFL